MFLEIGYQLDSVKNFTITTCQSDSDCPYYSLGCHKLVNVSICQFHIHCNKIHGCVALNQEYNHEIYKEKGEFRNANPANSKLGNTTYLFNNIYSKDIQCSSDEECFSQNCYLGGCISKKDDPISVCHILEKKEESDLSLNSIVFKDNQNVLDIVCKRGILEKCNIYSDCITNGCKGYIYNICVINDDRIIDVLLFFISLLLFAIIYVNILICCLFCKKKLNFKSYQRKYRKFEQCNPHLINRDIKK